MDGTTIIAIGSTLTVVVGAVVAAYISFAKSKADNDKTKRNGVIEEWRQITNKLQESHENCLKHGQEQEVEIKALRIEVTKLYGEVSALRTQINAREAERVEQRDDIRALEKKVVGGPKVSQLK